MPISGSVDCIEVAIVVEGNEVSFRFSQTLQGTNGCSISGINIRFVDSNTKLSQAEECREDDKEEHECA